MMSSLSSLRKRRIKGPSTILFSGHASLNGTFGVKFFDYFSSCHPFPPLGGIKGSSAILPITRNALFKMLNAPRFFLIGISCLGIYLKVLAQIHSGGVKLALMNGASVTRFLRCAAGRLHFLAYTRKLRQLRKK